MSDFIIPDGAVLIPLHGKHGSGLHAIVDQDLLPILTPYTWRLSGTRGRYVATRQIDGGFTWMHRMILDAPKDLIVDHINRNVLDNRKSNLRLATKSENMRNRESSKGSSLYKGVYWEKGEKIWRACIRVDGRNIRLGRFADEVEAAKAYDAASLKYHKEYGRRNFE